MENLPNLLILEKPDIWFVLGQLSKLVVESVYTSWGSLTTWLLKRLGSVNPSVPNKATLASSSSKLCRVSASLCHCFYHSLNILGLRESTGNFQQGKQ